MTRTLQSEPRRDGYRMPGEFEPHAGCWMLWPERPDNWRLGAKPAQEAFVAVATAIAGSERVSVGVSAAQFANARRRLPAAVRVVHPHARPVLPVRLEQDVGGVDACRSRPDDGQPELGHRGFLPSAAAISEILCEAGERFAP